jgi:hypothetical protein
VRLLLLALLGGFAFGLLLALHLSRVYATINHDGKAAGFLSGLRDVPISHAPNRAPERLPVQLRLKHKRLYP